MSRMGSALLWLARCFPRSRGDEPHFSKDLYDLEKFSPLTRG